MGGDGELARGQCSGDAKAEFRVDRVRSGAEGWIYAEATRDRVRDQPRRTHARACPPAREGTSGRRERLIFTEGRRTRPWQAGIVASRESADHEDRT